MRNVCFWWTPPRRNQKTYNAMTDSYAPGQLRISQEVLDKIALSAVREIEGVEDIIGFAASAVVGGLAGGALGMVHGGPVAAAVGATLGAAALASANEYLGRLDRQRTMHLSGVAHRISYRLRISVRYGADVNRIAADVRARVFREVEDQTGLSLDTIQVDIVDVNP